MRSPILVIRGSTANARNGVASSGDSLPPIVAKESLGVIESYTARIDFQAVGLDLLAIAHVKTTFEKLQDCLKLFASMPEVLEVYRVTAGTV